jgi:uncharacterized protein YndB with AHSA1/START domain
MHRAMAKKILIALAVVFAVLVGIISMVPAAFLVERHTTIAAPPSVVYSQVDDFHNWARWSPWDKLDADLKRTYSGPTNGLNAHYEWSGEKTGDGNMTITEDKPNERVAIALNFVKPFKAENLSTFVFTPSGAGTEVSWAMTGRRGFLEKAMALVMDMDKMVGPDFEKGLEGIKGLAEADAKAAMAAPPEATPEVDAGAP